MFCQELRRFAHFLGVDVKDCLEKALCSMAPCPGSLGFGSLRFKRKAGCCKWCCMILQVSNFICYKFDSHFGMISVVGSGFLLSSGSHFLSIWWYILPHSGPDFCRLLQAAPTRHAGCKTFDIIIGQPQQRIPNRWPTTPLISHSSEQRDIFVIIVGLEKSSTVSLSLIG